MTCRPSLILHALIAAFSCFLLPNAAGAQNTGDNSSASAYRVSSLCYACHSNLKTATGEDVSIGKEWRGSLMANASRDPYWQGSVRREALDHPEVSGVIQNDCGSCHMPLQHLRDKADGHETEVFKYLPMKAELGPDSAPEDGVSCAVCHQVEPTGLGTPATYNGNFAVAPLTEHPRAAFGPFAANSDRANQTHVVTTGYSIRPSSHMGDAGLCGSCHTLTTIARGPGGKELGKLPEQMVYVEWLHSDYNGKQTCQQCHMPVAAGQVALASLMSSPRDGLRRHTFTGANFLIEVMLDAHRDELGVTAHSDELAAAVERTTQFLQSQSARVTLNTARVSGEELTFAVKVENLTGHKLPTSFPSRRAWLHVTVIAADGQVVFESGKLNPDGSIAGNANDTDPRRYSPHYTKITKADEVQIFEPILGDVDGHVTTGLLSAVQYLKDNRILPKGFDKNSAPAEIAVHGEASTDAGFIAGSSTTTYTINAGAAKGPFHIAAELVYQPIGFRWAHNLEPYKEAEPERFVDYYNQAAAHSALVLTHADAQMSAER